MLIKLVRHGLSKFQERRYDQVDSLILAIMRFAIGIAIVFWALTYVKTVSYGGEKLPLYELVFLRPNFLFKYAGFEWVKLWPGIGIALHFHVTIIAGIMLAMGLFTRFSAAILSLSIAYVLLVERQIYVNHYYLLSCLAGLMVFLPAGRRLSVDSWLGIERPSKHFVRWQLWLLQFQVGIPYVYGAIAKMNADWLAGQPAGLFLSRRTNIWLVDLYMQLPFAHLIFAWSGLLYDLMIVPMLMFRKTRLLGIVLSLVFHLSNSQLFHIGVFPWFMLAGIIVFFPENTAAKCVWYLKSLSRWLGSKFSSHRHQPLEPFESSLQKDADQARPDRKDAPSSKWVKAGAYLAVAYVVVQMILPFRHWMLPGNPSWNERGHRFAWRMMLRNKRFLTTFKVVAPDGKYQFFPTTHFLTHTQSNNAEKNPELMRQTAVKIKKNAAEAGIKDAKVYCLSLVSLNGRRPVPIIDPDIDLSQAKRGWFKDSWVLQDPGPFQIPVWDQNLALWWQEVNLPEQFRELKEFMPSDLDALIQHQQATR